MKLKEEITDESSKYDNLLAKIKCPVQVIWGEEDQVKRVPFCSSFMTSSATFITAAVFHNNKNSGLNTLEIAPVLTDLSYYACFV